MILDKISNLNKYISFDNRFKMICDFINKHDMAGMENGRYDLENGVFVNISSYDPFPPEKAGWEAHRKYADLQCVFAGNEIITWAPLEKMNGAGDFFPNEDFQGFSGTDEKIDLIVPAGTFAYFAPQDVHMPGQKHTAQTVKKAVFKIPV